MTTAGAQLHIEKAARGGWLESPEGEGDLRALEAMAQAFFPGSGFSVREELERPWGRVWIARAAEKTAILGYVVGWHVADEVHVLNVATAEDARRRGVGTALMEEVIAYAATSRVRILILEVRRSNVPAILLYRKLGFAVLGIRKAYYADTGEDAVEMMLPLDPKTGLVLPAKDEEPLEL